MKEADRVLVIGGGAAGMMAATVAADSGAQVCLVEKNEKLGKKLFITGKGRCNVTNAADMEALFANVCTNSKFLYSAFYCFDNRALMAFLEQAGCPLKTERGDRVFPVSDHSSDVIAAFWRELKKRKVEILLNTEVKSLVMEEMHSADSEEIVVRDIDRENNKSKYKGKKDKGHMPHKRVTGVRLADDSVLRADRVIVCTGGLSYPSTGSTGDGYRFAEEAGLKVEDCSPSLVPFEVRESWCSELMGLSLRNVEVKLFSDGKEVYRGFGEMMFTHFGVSGPLILSASSYYGRQSGKRNGEAGGETKLFVDLKPAMDPEQLDKRLLRDFDENKNRQFKNALSGLFPVKLIPVMVELSGIDPEKKVNEISREERKRFGSLIKQLPLTVTGTRGYAEAVITRGGVSVKEIDPSTMEAKKVKGLYFAGEVLDLDALTGGFNLQIAWSTGYLAGQHSAGYMSSVVNEGREK